MVGTLGLEFKGMMFYLVMTFIALNQSATYGKLIHELNSSEINSMLRLLNKPAVKSIQSEDGDVIDCIDIYKQPAFDHPDLRNHTIQMKPSYDPTTGATKTKQVSPKNVRSQVWQRNNGSCPDGTIPIRRISKKDLLRVSSIRNYGRKKSDILPLKDAVKSFLQGNHSKAILLTGGFRYLGAKGDISVFNPYVEADEESSTARICLTNGNYHSYDSIESGWAVNPSVYGDEQTRLYAYWTRDASVKTGCFDLTCPGFVQTSREIALGSTISQYQITIYIFQDPDTRNWWLRYGDYINIGYWPADIFSRIKYSATSAEWGGEVYSPRLGKTPHTATEMGSGTFFPVPEGGTCVITRIRVLENSLILKFPEWVDTYTDEYNCYDVSYSEDYVEEPEFYFGCPGRSPRCP